MTITKHINDHPFTFAETAANTEDYRRIYPQFTFESPPRPVWVMRCATESCPLHSQAVYRIIPAARQGDRQLWRITVPHGTNLLTVTPNEPFVSFDAAATAAAHHHLDQLKQQPPADDTYRQFRAEAGRFLEQTAA